ncbi:MAG: hypothetical protein AAGA20_24485 [Planctomycetota bacterium]
MEAGRSVQLDELESDGDRLVDGVLDEREIEPALGDRRVVRGESRSPRERLGGIARSSDQ